MSRNFAKTLFLARQFEQHHLTHGTRIQIPSSSLHDLRTLIPSRTRPSRNRIRCFSTCNQWHAQKSAKDDQKSGMISKMQDMYKQAQKEGTIPEDIGLLPNTFIMPTGKNLPSWTKNRRGRMKLEKARLWERMQDIGAAMMFRFFHMDPRPRIRLREIPKIGENLHKQMYEHFAAGNLAPMENQIFSGLMGSLRGRMAQRPAGTQLKWTLHKYLSKTKLVQWRPMFLPGPKEETKKHRRGMLQAVVRIHSLQSLQHIRKRARGQKGYMEILVDPQGRELPSQDPAQAEKHVKELVEYIVLQKVIRNSREGAWKIWGTAEETTLDKLEKASKKRSPGSVPATA